MPAARETVVRRIGAARARRRPGSVMRGDLLAAGLVLLAGLRLLIVHAGVGFVGWDTYPIIAASRIESLEDLRGTFTEWLAQGYFPFGFYRPLLNLSMAADYAIWGLDPFGYRLTHVLMFAACGFALYRLARGLLGERATLAPFVTLLTYIVLPVHRELTTGPFSHRGDLMCALFVVLALLLQLGRLDADRPSRHVLPAVFTLLAQASKETAVVLPVLVFVLVMVADVPSLRPGSRLRRALAIAGWHALAVLVVLVPRTIVVGGVAGHAGTQITALVSRFPGAFGQVVLGLVAKWPAHLVTRADWCALFAVVALAAVAVLALHRGRRRSSDDGDDDATRASATVLLGLAMMAAFAAIYAIVGWVVPWYLLLPGVGLALACGGLVAALGLQARQAGRMRLAADAALALLGVWLVWQLSTSPLVRTDPIWTSWTMQNDAFLERLAARVGESPDGAEVHIAYPSPVLQPYSIQAWLDIVVPQRHAHVVDEGKAPGGAQPGVTVVLSRQMVRLP